MGLKENTQDQYYFPTEFILYTYNNPSSDIMLDIRNSLDIVVMIVR